MKPALRSPPAETLCMLDIMLIYHKKDKHVNVLRPPFRGRGPRSGEGVYEAASSHDTLCGGDHRKGAVKLRRQPPPQTPAQRAVSLRTLRTSACGGDVNLFCCPFAFWTFPSATLMHSPPQAAITCGKAMLLFLTLRREPQFHIANIVYFLYTIEMKK